MKKPSQSIFMEHIKKGNLIEYIQLNALIKIKGYCPDLSFSQAILINQSMSSILTTNFDSISMLRTPQLKCYIKTIHQVSKEQLKEIMAIGKPQKSADESA